MISHFCDFNQIKNSIKKCTTFYGKSGSNIPILYLSLTYLQQSKYQALIVYEETYVLLAQVMPNLNLFKAGFVFNTVSLDAETFKQNK